ncbi:MAG: undecaprenyl-diphosphate phosphatase [Acetobacteraceae bacterium]
MRELVEAGFLGIVEGLTEFLPVSSTGHLILAGELMGFQGPPGKVFEIVIQLGAILAVLVLYAGRFWNVALGLGHDPGARRFVMAVVLAFLPAAVIGVLAHGFIKSVLFSPYVVCVALIVGGIAILVIERIRPVPVINQIERFTPMLALNIGLIQCLAMIPGVSRSGATILGALMLGVGRKTAAEFSFFLAVPTLLGAAVYDLYKNRGGLTSEGWELIAVGFLMAFISAMLVIRWFVGFVSRHGFTPFAWYRIVAGIVLLVALLV